MQAIVVRLNDFEWWMGRTLTSIKRAYLENTKLTPEEAFDEPHILSFAEMEKLTFDPQDETGKRTFAGEFYKRLSDGWDGKPQMFATTEY